MIIVDYTCVFAASPVKTSHFAGWFAAQSGRGGMFRRESVAKHILYWLALTSYDTITLSCSVVTQVFQQEFHLIVSWNKVAKPLQWHMMFKLWSVCGLKWSATKSIELKKKQHFMKFRVTLQPVIGRRWKKNYYKNDIWLYLSER